MLGIPPTFWRQNGTRRVYTNSPATVDAGLQTTESCPQCRTGFLVHGKNEVRCIERIPPEDEGWHRDLQGRPLNYKEGCGYRIALPGAAPVVTPLTTALVPTSRPPVVKPVVAAALSVNRGPFARTVGYIMDTNTSGWGVDTYRGDTPQLDGLNQFQAAVKLTVNRIGAEERRETRFRNKDVVWSNDSGVLTADLGGRKYQVTALALSHWLDNVKYVRKKTRYLRQCLLHMEKEGSIGIDRAVEILNDITPHLEGRLRAATRLPTGNKDEAPRQWFATYSSRYAAYNGAHFLTDAAAVFNDPKWKGYCVYNGTTTDISFSAINMESEVKAKGNIRVGDISKLKVEGSTNDAKGSRVLGGGGLYRYWCDNGCDAIDEASVWNIVSESGKAGIVHSGNPYAVARQVRTQLCKVRDNLEPLGNLYSVVAATPHDVVFDTPLQTTLREFVLPRIKGELVTDIRNSQKNADGKRLSPEEARDLTVELLLNNVVEDESFSTFDKVYVGTLVDAVTKFHQREFVTNVRHANSSGMAVLQALQPKLKRLQLL